MRNLELHRNGAELRKLHARAKKIVESDTLDWERKYAMIFSQEMAHRVFQLIRIDYYDPDTSYQEDVMAFMNAFDAVMVPIAQR